MRVLLTGADGYIGAVLGPILLEQGYDVVGLDTGYYRGGWLFHDTAVTRLPAMISKDLRSITADDLASFDSVVHLAELSNDPLGEHDPQITYEINHQGSVRLAQLAKAAGVTRFIYTSSCSVYGVAEGVVDETSPVNPQTAYARCKTFVERDVSALADATFSPVFLRNATAYGASPRMRFDIVLNNLAGLAWTTKEIALTSDGSPWRPLVHIRDIARAVTCALGAPAAAVHNEVFNVGDSQSNYQIRQVAEIVGGAFPGCRVSFGAPSGDNRSYRVSFSKIRDQLPGFSCEWNALRGAQELRQVFERIQMDRSTFEAPPYTRLKCLTTLLNTGQLDSRFHWSR
jgi:nucleoside-diphosphate-sugar epimerase